jgi:hypothetical protein
MLANARVASLSLVITSALLAVPSHAADPKLDPDPKILPKARTLATAKVDQNFDLPSDKIPFSIRFGICVVQLTAIRDEGRALPAPRADLDKVIADYRALAIELKAYAAKLSAAEAQKAVDTELEKAAPDTLKFAREDTTALGVAIRTARNTDRLLACQLTRDWYAAQNGLAAPVAAAEQAKVAVLNEQQRAAEKAAAPKPPELPYPPAIYPKVVKPSVVATAPAAPAAATIPAAPSFIPPPGTPAGGDDARDARVGSDITDARARAEFSGRPIWSAMVECIDRMELIQAKGGGSAKVQIDGYADSASSLAKLDRGVDQAAASALVAKERERLRPRVAAKWDADYARMRALPWGEWGLMCYGLQQHAVGHINRKNNAAYQKYLADFQRQRQIDNERSLTNSATTTSGGTTSAPSSSGDNGAAARREHEATMQRYKQDTQKIRDDIKAIDRKYR